MRKALALAALAGLLLSTAAMAVATDVVLYPSYNLIAPPCVPFDPTPETCFTDSTGTAIPIDGKLIRFNAMTQSYVYYDWIFPEDYGKMLLGDGAWLNLDSLSSGTVTWRYDAVYDGVPSDLTDETTRAATMTDMWISLPKAGDTLIGHPFNHTVALANVKMTDGTQTVDLATARDVLQWTDANLWLYNAETQSYEDVGLDPWSARADLEAGHAYWIKTTKDNLALIIPAN